MKRIFQKNNIGISSMYDAVFFIVLVSLSGIVLIPALQSDIAINTSIDEHREITVDDTLLLLTNSKVEYFDYIFAGSQIEYFSDLIGLDIDDENSLFYSIVKTLLGKEQLHKTYADLCVENLVSQLNVFGYRLNIFTEDYDNRLYEKITNLLSSFLSDKYEFNLSVKWCPIKGINFGGELKIGSRPPDNTYVAKTYVTLSDNFFSEWLNNLEEFIENQIEKIKHEYLNLSLNGNFSELRLIITNLINDTVNGFLFDGFVLGNNRFPGVIERIIDSVFGEITDSIENVFDEGLSMVSESFSVFDYLSGYIDLGKGLTDFLLQTINELPGLEGLVGIDDAIFCLQNYVINLTCDIFHSSFDIYIYEFVDYIISELDNVNDLVDELNDFFKEQINVLRADFVLTIWEVRG